MSDLIAKAASYAQKWHGGQVRKYTNAPYFTHPAAVAERAKVYTSEPYIIAAAWLHDILEDTDRVFDDIVKEFGFDVAAVVSDLTDVYTSEAYPMWNRAERKKREVERLSGICYQAKIVKLCDIADNAETIEKYDPGFAKIWLPEKHAAARAMLTQMEWHNGR